MPPNWKSRIGAVLVGVLASAVAGALGFAVVVFVWPGPTRVGHSAAATARMRDMNSLRVICALLAAEETLPMKDGALDPYRLVRKGVISGRGLRLFDSERSGTIHPGEEMARGDYTNFAWERYRGDGKLGGPPFPLLWEKTPDDKGMVLVGLSDGTAAYWELAKLEAALIEKR